MVSPLAVAAIASAIVVKAHPLAQTVTVAARPADATIKLMTIGASIDAITGLSALDRATLGWSKVCGSDL